ncbi:MAG: hypothetical protein MI919_22595 [Holophagales bacterium]|nr:hypothetical protein [Holophagales bacterium]
MPALSPFRWAAGPVFAGFRLRRSQRASVSVFDAFLGACATLSILVGVSPSAAGTGGSGADLGSAVLIDLRRPAVESSGRDGASRGGAPIPGAIPFRLDLDDLSEPEAYQRLPSISGLAPSSRVVLLGGPGERARVARAFVPLEHLGFEVGILRGSIDALPSPSGLGGLLTDVPAKAVLDPAFPPTDSGSPERAKPREALVDVDWLRERYGESGIEIVDTRDAGSWVRYEPPEPYSAGHIPHGLPFDILSLFPADGVWPAEDRWRAEAVSRFRRFGPREGTLVPASSTFVLYGHDASDDVPYLGYVALRLLGFDARVLAGGWGQWMSEPASPVVRIVDAETLGGLLSDSNPDLADEPGSELLLFDSRMEWDWRLRRIPSARSLPAYDFASSFEQVLTEIDPALDRGRVPIVFYCYGVDCVRSRNSSTWAARAGFREILWFRDGLDGWTESGLPLASSYSKAERDDPSK